MMRMQLRMLDEIVEAVKAMRALAVESADGLGRRVEEIANELLFEISEILVDYERTDAMSVLHKLYCSEIAYEDFVKRVLDYRRPIVGEETPDDWELPFYGLLMLTEPVSTINEGEACDEQGA